MEGGKKILARDIVEKGFQQIKRIQLRKYHKAETDEEKQAIELRPKAIFHQAVDNCKPILKLTPIKRGGVRYQVLPATAFTGSHTLFLGTYTIDGCTIRVYFYEMAVGSNKY